ncbi:MAG TPA: hypothetical protein VHB21_15145, partial [Minicystis sp.]|nr:hypothetical protein [Minicystis sp.]
MKALHSRGERRSGAVNYLAVALVGLALGSAACVDPAGAYSDFKKRYDASMTTSSAGGSTSMSSSSSGMMGGGGAGGC